MSEPQRRIEVNNVWKVFGGNPDAALRPEHAAKSRDEVRQELGVVLAQKVDQLPGLAADGGDQVHV